MNPNSEEKLHVSVKKFTRIMVGIAIGFIALYLFIFFQLKQTESQLTSYGNVTDSAIGNFLENLPESDSVKVEKTVNGITFIVKGGEGSSLNADLFDSKNSDYFLNATNIAEGTLKDSVYSAWKDLEAEGFVSNGKIKPEFLPTTSGGTTTTTTTNIDWNNIQNRPAGLDNGDDVGALSETQVEEYITNAAINLASSSTINGNALATESWVSSQNYLSSVNFSQITNSSGGFLDYRPNNTACAQGETLKYDAGLNRWTCGTDIGAGSMSWGGISGTLSDQTDLVSALGSKLNTTASFGGDASGTYDAVVIANDSHNHTSATISGLTTADFTSTNISQWNNDAGFISNDTSVAKNEITNTGTLPFVWEMAELATQVIVEGEDISLLNNNSGYITGVNFSQVTNGTGVYLNYKPNDVACDHGQTLKYDAGLTRWACGDDNGAGTIVWGDLTGNIADQGDLSTVLSSKLNLTADFGGDASGTYDNLQIANDSHAHTGASITGLGTANFTSENISQWNNDAGFISGLDISQITNGSGKYFNYKPNDVECSDGGILEYDAGNARWICGVDNSSVGGGEVTVGSMTGDTLFADSTADDDWLGLGTSAGKIEFDDQSTDEINFLNANVGIGTDTPTRTLEISKSSSSGNDTLLPQARIINTNPSQENGTSAYNIASLTVAAGNGAVEGWLTASYNSGGAVGSGVDFRIITDHNFNIWTDDTKRLTITNNGRVGIGVTSPMSNLQVVLDDNQLAHFGNTITTSGHYSGISIGYGEAGPAYVKSALVQEQLGDGAARAKIHILNNGTNDASNATITDARLTINYDGNVGIGQTAPTHKLDVNGNLGLATSGYINFGATDGETGYGFRDNAGVIEYKDASGNWIALNSLTGGGGGGGSSDQYVLVRDEKPAGTQGGTMTAGSWFTRILNTEVSDTGNISSLSSNQITLPAGTYRTHIIVPAMGVGAHQAKLYNVTDDSDLLLGTSIHSLDGNYVQNNSEINGMFTLTATTVLEVRHRGSFNKADWGLGHMANFGVTEIYTVAEFIKVNATTPSASWKLEPDEPPASPDAMDDEFNDGSIDAKWTQYTDAGGNASYIEANNVLELKHNSSAGNTNRFIALLQDVPSGNWKFRTKMHIEGAIWTYVGGGIMARRTSNDKNQFFAFLKHDSLGDGLTGYYGRLTGSAFNSETDKANAWTQTYYLEVEYDGTNLYYRSSTSGVSYQLMHTEDVATHMGGAPDEIGILLHPYSTTALFTPQITFDWFRRIE